MATANTASSERAERNENFFFRSNRDDLPVERELSVYPYAQYAIDDGDEWCTWLETNHSHVPMNEAVEKMKSFEHQQVKPHALLAIASLADRPRFHLTGCDLQSAR